MSSGAGPSLVMLHGFTGSTETWDAIRSQLDSHFRIIAIDFPGHGKSSAPADSARYSLGRFADDLSRVLDALAVEHASVFGYSMGGRAALRFAIAHPDRVSSLILESTSSGIPDERARRQRIEADESLAASIERDGIEAFVARWENLPMWSSQSALGDSGRARLRAQRLANSAIGLANSLRGAGAGVDAPVLDRAGEITAPALLLAGGLDIQYIEHGKRLAAAIPNAKLEIIPDAGHAIHLENPDAVVREITAFARVD
ncbi:MAG TPA: 2-succinyl-6-hydroxy-2,4-cyclohexadiene-1-carboxylate synthase [Gemmatimonadaceae bacterium]|nr:2-succinyl-6-hydroxy-2,4-cyclohexadiene-1-carboxylate synthase [Gemmatimonadaceae bacterium]